jgi:hypothetical protein
MMGLVIALSLGLAAMVSESGLACDALYTITMIALGLSLTGAIAARGPTRSFCVGFAVFGSGYLYLSSYPNESSWPARRIWYPAQESTHPRLLSESLLGWLHDKAGRRGHLAAGQQVQVQWGNWNSYYPAEVVSHGEGLVQIHWQNYPADQTEYVASARVRGMAPSYFFETGHTLLAWLLGVLGGLGSRALFGRLLPHDQPLARQGGSVP